MEERSEAKSKTPTPDSRYLPLQIDSVRPTLLGPHPVFYRTRFFVGTGEATYLSGVSKIL